MIIKYVHNGDIACTYYDNEQVFLNECRKPEFKDVLFDAKDVIVLENSGHSFMYNNMLEVYHKYANYVIKEDNK